MYLLGTNVWFKYYTAVIVGKSQSIRMECVIENTKQKNIQIKDCYIDLCFGCKCDFNVSLLRFHSDNFTYNLYVNDLDLFFLFCLFISRMHLKNQYNRFFYRNKTKITQKRVADFVYRSLRRQRWSRYGFLMLPLPYVMWKSYYSVYSRWTLYSVFVEHKQKQSTTKLMIGSNR